MLKVLLFYLMIVRSGIEFQTSKDTARAFEFTSIISFDSNINKMKSMDLIDHSSHDINFSLKTKIFYF